MANTPIRMGINHTPNSNEAKKNAHKFLTHSLIRQKFYSSKLTSVFKPLRVNPVENQHQKEYQFEDNESLHPTKRTTSTKHHANLANSVIRQMFKSDIYFFLRAKLAFKCAGFLHSSGNLEIYFNIDSIITNSNIVNSILLIINIHR